MVNLKAVSESKRTPGPWAVNGRTNLGYRIDSLRSDRTGIEFLTAPVAVAPRETDARLMSAAPDLLKVLKSMNQDEYAYCICPAKDGHLPYEQHATICVMAQKAIAKAEGR